ncbi:hypothetical protein FB451DRAFT_1180847 [Mycena latifolia]|nr:hypothetical protein FB451DRAFT_1180847 [Mycena latifolia]
MYGRGSDDAVNRKFAWGHGARDVAGGVNEGHVTWRARAAGRMRRRRVTTRSQSRVPFGAWRSTGAARDVAGGGNGATEEEREEKGSGARAQRRGRHRRDRRHELGGRAAGPWLGEAGTGGHSGSGWGGKGCPTWPKLASEHRAGAARTTAG